MNLTGCTPFPQEVAARYRARGYWRGETLGNALRRWSALHGAREALVGDGRRATFAELDALSDGVARQLRELGLAPNARILLQMTNRFEFVPLLFGCFRAGVLPVLALPQHRTAELTHFAKHAQAVAIAVAGDDERTDYVELARTVRAEVASVTTILTAGAARHDGCEALSLDASARPAAGDDVRDARQVAMFLLSGGTTGYPKMIPRTHDDYAYNFRRSGEVAGFGEDTRFLVALPIAHNFPLGSPGFLGALERGGAAILARDPSVATCFPLVEREGVTHAAVVPTVAGRWIEAEATERTRLRSLRVLQVGGARLPETVAARVRPELGCALQQVFGMAEGLLNFTRLDDDEELMLTTQGVPMSADDELRVVDEDGSDVAPGSPGELLVRGPYTLRGYYDAEHHNVRCFTPDGYYRSGDIVRRLASGHLVVDGRIKDIINRGGEKISAEDVENHLLAHPQVLEAAVVAMPDAIFGERACAFVVLRDSARPLGLEELVTHFVSRGLAKGMTPERVEFVERLPLTNVGKIDKKALRERIAALLLGAVEA